MKPTIWHSAIGLGAVLAAQPLVAAPPIPAAAAPAPEAPAPAASAALTRDQVMQRSAQEFAAIDVNHDGKASPAEIEAFRRSQVLAALRLRNSRAFERLDADKNGYLSKEEFAKLVPNDVKVNVAPLIQRGDRDKDGSLSAAEFRAVAADEFKQRDKNGDGVMSRDEIGAAGI